MNNDNECSDGGREVYTNSLKLNSVTMVKCMAHHTMNLNHNGAGGMPLERVNLFILNFIQFNFKFDFKFYSI